MFQNDNSDFLNPINFRLTFKLKESSPPTMIPGQDVPDFNTYPVLNQDLANADLRLYMI
mgnify:CR=1 FL=1